MNAFTNAAARYRPSGYYGGYYGGYYRGYGGYGKSATNPRLGDKEDSCSSTFFQDTTTEAMDSFKVARPATNPFL